MKYISTLLVTRDMERTKFFYCNVLGLKITADFGANVTFSDRITYQTYDTWKEFINKDDSQVALKNNCGEIYFEEENIDSFIKKLEKHPEINYVHKVKEHSWGQRVVRFYDPDGNIIEVGEAMTSVIKRFLDTGLSVAETAKRMDVSVDYIKSMM